MNQDETSKNLSMQKTLLPGHDPGWNDPPNWALGASQTSATTPTKRVLNKRVAFPVASTDATNNESSSQNKLMNMPPPLQSSVNLTTASHPPIVSPSGKSAGEKRREVEIDKDRALNDALGNLEAVINEHILEASRAEEVKKRLDVLKAAWLEDKLNSTIHKNVLDLSTALREGNVEKADQIHLALMMQHASLCNLWIPGIRHIILGLKTNLQNSNSM